ncbi:MAG TPA: hypothetical protein VJQ25_10940, partial [Nitrospira sp.]|nr:hypothetical protein [Nitrospira sp.]
MKKTGAIAFAGLLALAAPVWGQRIEFAPGGGGDGGSGTVTSVGFSTPGGVFSVTGTNPVMTAGTFGFAVSGSSGGILFFSSDSAVSSSDTLPAGKPIVGGGEGGPPTVGDVT